MVRAIIYDMDGVLIDSEPLWRRAEVTVFGDYSVPLTESMCTQTMGLRVDEVVQYWAQRYPIKASAFPEIEEHILEEVVRLVGEFGEVLPGVRSSLAFLRTQGVSIALASSSHMRLIDVVLKKLALQESFEQVYSAEHEPYGKPHPGVYLTTATLLGVRPQDCLAIEDSVNGLVAAKAAQMKCIAVPDRDHMQDGRFGLADVVLNSLDELDEARWAELQK